MVEQALTLGDSTCAVAQGRCPAGSRVGRLAGARILAIFQSPALSIAGDVESALLARLGEVFVGAGAVIVIGRDGGALVASAALELRRDGLDEGGVVRIRTRCKGKGKGKPRGLGAGVGMARTALA